MSCHLSPRAAKAWPQIRRFLDGMDVLTKADGIVVNLLCEAFADWPEARNEVEGNGPTWPTPSGGGP